MIKSPQLHMSIPEFQSSAVSSGNGNNKSENKSLPKINTSHEETEKEYCYGGYHPVCIHDKLGPNKNYQIVRKLGWGQFSTVWLALDTINNDYYALKIVKSSPSYTEAALDEIRILERVNSRDPTHPGFEYLVKLYDWFYHDGPNGQHVVMAFEVLGESLLSLVSTFSDEKKYEAMNLAQFGKTYGGLPLNIVKKITKQMCLAFDYLHRVCGLIHTDIKPENVLIEIKNVEKFIQMLDISEDLETFHLVDSPIKHSNPLPSPILRSDSYFNLSSSSNSRSKAKSSSSTSNSSVNYYENYTTSDPVDEEPTSISPTLQPIVHVPSNLCFVTTSETDSDSEDEFDGETPTHTGFSSARNSDYFELPTGHKLRTDLGEEELEDLEASINIKIADLGNACYYNYHFTNNIQTRQYRSPEIILGAKTWGASADAWSLGCLVFELITGDFLFNPATSTSFSKDDDHLAQIIELIKPSTEDLLSLLKLNCKYKDDFFKAYENAECDCGIEIHLKKIKKLKYWSLFDVLHEKYHMKRKDAQELADFLLPLLRLRPKDRVDLGGWSNHRWLNYEPSEDSESAPIRKLDRKCGSIGKDIRGWYKMHINSDPARRHSSSK